MPIPIIAVKIIIFSWAVANRDNNNEPAARKSIPRTARGRKLIFSSSRLPNTLAITQPSIIGARVLPASVADVPSTACTNSGINDRLPNIAQPASSPWAEATANSRRPNR